MIFSYQGGFVNIWIPQLWIYPSPNPYLQFPHSLISLCMTVIMIVTIGLCPCPWQERIITPRATKFRSAKPNWAKWHSSWLKEIIMALCVDYNVHVVSLFRSLALNALFLPFFSPAATSPVICHTDQCVFWQKHNISVNLLSARCASG